jgi:shikimate kinase
MRTVIFLVGLRAVGETWIAETVRTTLGIPYLDADPLTARATA